MTATAEYQVQKLKELGLATKTINDILAEALNTSNEKIEEDRKSTRLNSSTDQSRMPSSA